MNISLYKAADDVRKLFDQMDAETGELPEGFEPAREIVIRKSAAVAAYILESVAYPHLTLPTIFRV